MTELYDPEDLSWMVMILLWVGVAVLGGIITFYSLRAGRKTGDRSMVLLGVGFGFLSLATAGVWFGSYLIGTGLFVASMGCTAMLAVGFGVIFAGLRMRPI